jgi:ubiquinone/menaquinone biosynthesis C-methylase UbiE
VGEVRPSLSGADGRNELTSATFMRSLAAAMADLTTLPTVSPGLVRTAYRLSQGLRMAWYSGLYRLTSQITSRVPAAPEVKARMPSRRDLMAGLEDLLARDLANIEAGRYRMPHDWLPRPAAWLTQAARYLVDLSEVERRRRHRDGQEVWREAERRGYPRYYLQNFHYQTDGYLSRRSAELYDVQVEVLFGGSADAMRRQALPPLGEHLAQRGIAGTRLLDVACGTGRFLGFVKDNWPRLETVGLDMSGAYLAAAGDALRPYRRVRLVEGAAERLPFADGSFDIVSCLYLLHELPRKVRRLAAAEISRALAPGGLLLLVDSLQLGDVPAYDALLEHFPVAFHEPYYADYVRDDLGAMFAAAGLRPEGTEIAYLSRVMRFRKPETAARARVSAAKRPTPPTARNRADPSPTGGRSRRARSIRGGA